MCDCSEDSNINSIPVGPQGPAGPTGPQGPAGPSGPGSVGTSTTFLAPVVGVATFTISEDDLDWGTGQRLRVTNDAATIIAEGEVISYSGNTLELDVDYVVGGGAPNADWNISVTGARGATGATGAAGDTGDPGEAAFTEMTTGTSLGSDLYRLDVTSTAWMSEDMYLFIELAGYYRVTSVLSATQVVVYNPGYSDNVAAELVSGDTKKVSPGGVAGHDGVNGTNGFIYETVDGNATAAEASAPYDVMIRNSGDTGYVWISLAELKILLDALP